MVKDGEDWHRLQTTKLKNLGQTFQTIQPSLCSVNYLPNQIQKFDSDVALLPRFCQT